MSTANQLLTSACEDGINCLGSRDLMVVIAQALSAGLDMTATQLLAAACESGIACLNDRDLRVVMAEGINQGGGGGGGGTGGTCGDVDPVTAPASGCPTYYNKTAGSFWVWNSGTSAWDKLIG